MKNYYNKFLAIILSLCLCIFIAPQTVNAVTPSEPVSVAPALSEMSDIEMIMAGIKTVEEVFGKLDEETVPEIVGYNEAVASNHVERLYEDEGRDLNKVVFLNADGTKTAYIYDFPVKYMTKTGAIKDITLDIAEGNEASFVSAANSTVTTFSPDAKNGIQLSGNGTSLCLVPLIPQEAPKADSSKTTHMSTTATVRRINQKTVAYEYDSKTDIEYSLTYTGFKEDIVVEEYTGQTEYEFTLYTNGLELVSIDGSYYLVDSNDNIKATLGDIIIFTADERNNTFGSMRSRTVVENEEYVITIVIDPEFLADENTKYPIKIDPTIEISYDNNGSSAISDVTINSLEGSSGTSSALMIGKRQTYGISRVLMKFPGLDFDDLGSNISITGASVKIRDLLCETSSMDISCYIFTGNEWDESTVSWANVNANSYSDLLSSKTVSYSNGTQQPHAHWYAFDITDAVAGWRAGTCNEDKGIIFKASSSVENGSTYIHKTFASFNRASYKPSLSVTYSVASSLPISEDIYYLNNKYFGKYLTFDYTTLKPESNIISELNAKIRWEITRVESGYVLRSMAGSSKYLAVPDDPTNDSVSVITVNGSSIPQKCIWNISFAAGTGCLLRSAYNARYLICNESSIYTSDTTSTAGTNAYFTRTWRLISRSNMNNREMTDDSKFSPLKLDVGTIGEPILVPYPSDAIWTDVTDFEYEPLDNSRIAVNDGVFIGFATGVVTVRVTHKVTNIKLMLAVVVGNRPTLVIDNYIDQGYFVRYEGESQVYEYNAIVEDKFEQLFGIDAVLGYRSIVSSADTCKIETFGSVSVESVFEDQCPHVHNHITSPAMRSVLGEGTSIKPKVLWTGHILENNEASNSVSSTHSVIITPKLVVNNYNYNNLPASVIRRLSIVTLMHELSHQLGATDHYCYGKPDENSSCTNEHCYVCNGQPDEKNCLMGSDASTYDIETKNIAEIYCESCLNAINSHLTSHHQ